MQVPGIDDEIVLGGLLKGIMLHDLAGKAPCSDSRSSHRLRETPPPRKSKSMP